METEPKGNQERSQELKAFFDQERGKGRWLHGAAIGVCLVSAVWLACCALGCLSEGNTDAAIVLGGVAGLFYSPLGALLAHSFIIRLKSSAG